jgi:alginate O-acetyltransferase complex protein AlgI
MVFSSPIFLFLFLPVVLTGCLLLPSLPLKNRWLLFFSLVFYAWGEPGFILLAIASAAMNYRLGLWVDNTDDHRRRKFTVGLAIGFNIGLLAFFKYANFAVDNLNGLLGCLGWRHVGTHRILLPIGISFFTFHALSYVVDVYRRKCPAARNPSDVALYIFFFPQLIAGPILRWSAIAPQLAHRSVTRENFAEGIRRFSGGLAKKMIVANVVAVPADQIFALSGDLMTPAIAWLGVLCYTLQIYFDFSGYSDMAVGLGKMFGFVFLENFNFPYTAQSIREFWQRWHISLSTWFRDYLYIPLGGNRCSKWRNHLNLVMVFFLCGLWHGASWTFVIWGLYHGMFLVLERTRFGEFLHRLPRPVRHGYALLCVVFGWVLFRAESLPQAIHLMKSMFGLGGQVSASEPVARFLSHQVQWALGLGIIFSMPAWEKIRSGLGALCARLPAPVRPGVETLGLLLETGLFAGLLMISSVLIAGGTYNPFIYYRF